MNSYGMMVVPGFLGSKTVIDEWARTAHEAKTMLLTDFRDLAKPEQVMKVWEAGKYTGADEHKGDVMMTCNWLVGRPASAAIGESPNTGSKRINTYAPADTTTELRKIEAGFGPSIDSSSHRCSGN